MSTDEPGQAALHVAVVGSGPAGLYTAEALIKQSAALDPPLPVRVDVLDRLPTPYGLVRYGVAPDHPSIKSIAEYLRRILEHPDVRFLGGVHLGDDVTTPVKTFGLPQEFLSHAKREQILADTGLVPQHLAREITETVARLTPELEHNPSHDH